MRRRRAASRAPTVRGRIGWAVLIAAVATGPLPAGATDSTETTPTTTTPASTTTTVAAGTTTSTTTTTSAPVTSTSTTVPPGSTTTTTSPAAVTDDVTSTTSIPLPDGALELDDTDLGPEQIAELLELLEQYDELVADEAEKLAEYQIRLGRVEQLDLELALLDVDIARTEREVERAQAELDRILGEQRANEARRRETATELEDALDRLRRQAVNAFVFGGTGVIQALDLLLDAGSPQTADAAMTYANAIVEDQQATIDKVRALEGVLEAIGEEIDANRSAAEDARREVEELEARLEVQRVGMQVERDLADAERIELEGVLAAIRSRKKEYDERLNIMEIESDNVTGILARAQRDQPKAESIPLLRGPLDTTIPATSGFGPRLHPIFGTVRLHNGLDLGGDLGDPIRAVDAGVVVMAEMRNGFGNTIVIDHGDKIASLYAHQSHFEVEVGDEVARGELIGRIGSTGWSTGPHLHIEIRVEGLPVDPILYLVDGELLECELLISSKHAIDLALLATRDDCR